MKMTNGCVCKLGIPHYHTLDSLHIFTSCVLVFSTFDGILHHIQNTHTLFQDGKCEYFLLFISYLDDFIPLYRLSLISILVCQFTTGDKIMDVPEVKISVTLKRTDSSLINDHLKSENTTVSKMWLENLIIIC